MSALRKARQLQDSLTHDDDDDNVDDDIDDDNIDDDDDDDNPFGSVRPFHQTA
jgi:hypothetical protein